MDALDIWGRVQPWPRLLRFFLAFASQIGPPKFVLSNQPNIPQRFTQENPPPPPRCGGVSALSHPSVRPCPISKAAHPRPRPQHRSEGPRPTVGWGPGGRGRHRLPALPPWPSPAAPGPSPGGLKRHKSQTPASHPAPPPSGGGSPRGRSHIAPNHQTSSSHHTGRDSCKLVPQIIAKQHMNQGFSKIMNNTNKHERPRKTTNNNECAQAG